MAKKQTVGAVTPSKRDKPKKKRKGIHSKKKDSKNKTSKNYKKVYVSQGR
jgi:hypothetical protein